LRPGCRRLRRSRSLAGDLGRRLLDAGLFTKAPDSRDKRLLLIGLSDEAAERIRAYLAASGGLVGLAA